MTYPKLLDLTSKLVEATREGSVNWKESEADNVFQVSFSDNTVRISLRESRNAPVNDEYFLSIFNSDGDLVEEVGDEDGDNEHERAKLFRELKEMYEAARRKAMGVDQVLDEILRELDDHLPF